MDVDSEVGNLKGMLVAGLMFLVSGCYSWNEFRYLTFGRTTNARITQVSETVDFGRRGRRIPKLRVEYTFTDAEGTTRDEKTLVSVDTPVPTEGEVAIRYLPGVDESSRLADQIRWWAVILFGVSLVLIAAFLYRMHREANEPVTWRKRPSRR